MPIPARRRTREAGTGRRRAVLGLIAALPLTAVLAGQDSNQDRKGPPKAQDEELPDEKEGEYFKIADYDANGWLSYREARDSMGLTETDFGIYDKNDDGRIGRNEFNERYRRAVEVVGAFPRPKPQGPESRTASSTPIAVAIE